jgi:hypothetical protein
VHGARIVSWRLLKTGTSFHEHVEDVCESRTLLGNVSLNRYRSPPSTNCWRTPSDGVRLLACWRLERNLKHLITRLDERQVRRMDHESNVRPGGCVNVGQEILTVVQDADGEVLEEAVSSSSISHDTDLGWFTWSTVCL